VATVLIAEMTVDMIAVATAGMIVEAITVVVTVVQEDK